MFNMSAYNGSPLPIILHSRHNKNPVPTCAPLVFTPPLISSVTSQPDAMTQIRVSDCVQTEAERWYNSVIARTGPSIVSSEWSAEGWTQLTCMVPQTSIIEGNFRWVDVMIRATGLESPQYVVDELDDLYILEMWDQEWAVIDWATF